MYPEPGLYVSINQAFLFARPKAIPSESFHPCDLLTLCKRVSHFTVASKSERANDLLV